MSITAPAVADPVYLCVYCERLFDEPAEFRAHSLADHPAEWTDVAELDWEIADQARIYTWAEEMERRNLVLRAIRGHYGYIPDQSAVLADWPR
jgi:hypothetical protein